MHSLGSDLRHALRLCGRRPLFSATIVAVLALGIGANAAIFSVVEALLLRPLPFAAPERLVQVWVDNRRDGVDEEVISYPNFLDVEASAASFEGMAAFWPLPSGFHLTGGSEPEQVAGAFVTDDFFSLLGVRPALGRGFLPAEEVGGGPRVVALSDGLWRRRFGADPAILGREISLNGFPCMVVAVMPPEMRFPAGIELWRPMALPADLLADRETMWLQVIGRLRPGVALASARAELDGVAAALAAEHPAINRGRGLRAVPLAEQILGRARPAVLTLAGAVGLVLLIACANVANLLLAQAAAREREIAVRQALGAGPLRLLCQMLVESALLALAGGAAGLLLARWGVAGLVAAGAAEVPRLDGAALDTGVLAFTLALSLATGLLFGLAPAMAALRPRLGRALRDGGRGATGLAGSRAGRLLVVAEVALAVVLLVAGGLLVQSLRRALTADLGFVPGQVLSMRTNLHRNRLPELHQVYDLYRRLLARVEALPGVRSAAVGTSFLYADEMAGAAGYFIVEGRPPAPPEERITALFDGVSPGFFRTVGMPLLAGRDVAASDVAGAPPVVVVSAEMARRYWPEESPLGRRLRFVDGELRELPDVPWMTVVGVVGDARRAGPESEPRLATYVPFEQAQQRLGTIVVRAEGDASRLAAAIQREARALDPEIAFWDVATVEEQLSGLLAERRYGAALLGLFSALALALAALGLYGLMAYAVARSRREIGIRLALGATRADVARLVAGRGGRLALQGVALGLVAAWGASRLLASQLYGVTATDPATYAGVAAVLLATALAASLLPARRAARVDPGVTLRGE